MDVANCNVFRTKRPWIEVALSNQVARRAVVVETSGDEVDIVVREAFYWSDQNKRHKG
jgi:hypothetical protein